MRIIAGAARGRRVLSVPLDAPVRPMSARIRQSLFDILRPRITGSRFLDLFAGTGVVGLEALSRGAEAAVFVDLDRRCVKVIERNLERAGWAGRGKVFRANVIGSLTWIPVRSRITDFDIVFLGPPYWESGAGGGEDIPAEPRVRREGARRDRRTSEPAESAEPAAAGRPGPPADPAHASVRKPFFVADRMLAHVLASDILAPDGWVVAQHQRREAVIPPAGLEVFRSSRYGDTVLSFARRSGRLRSDISSC